MSRFDQVPAEACVMNAAAVQFRSNGDDAASAPFELLARSAQPIDHWYWGRVVHDFAGMNAKNRLPIDWNHDPNEAIGFSNKREVTADGLVLSGSVVSTRVGDRADTIIKQSAKGVPFEASIFFGGDGIKIEEVMEGMVAPVNGTQFEGPGVIIREWPLRGCAICLHGADQNTASTLFSVAGKFSASVIPQPKKEEVQSMPPVEPVPTALNAAPAIESPQAVEITPVEVAPAAVDPEKVVEAEPAALSAAQIVEIATEFGSDIAIKVAAKKGGNYADALRFQNEALKAELVEARKAQPISTPTPTATPAKFADGEPGKAKKTPKKMRDAALFAK